MANHFMIPSGLPLQQLHFLDKASPQFHEQLSSLLHGNAFQSAFLNLQSESLAWLVEYLDSVRLKTTLLHLFVQPRLSFSLIFPIIQPPYSWNLCTD